MMAKTKTKTKTPRTLEQCWDHKPGATLNVDVTDEELSAGLTLLVVGLALVPADDTISAHGMLVAVAWDGRGYRLLRASRAAMRANLIYAIQTESVGMVNPVSGELTSISEMRRGDQAILDPPLLTRIRLEAPKSGRRFSYYLEGRSILEEEREQLLLPAAHAEGLALLPAPEDAKKKAE